MPNDWEVLVGAGADLLICEDCITPEERQAIDDADIELGDDAN